MDFRQSAYDRLLQGIFRRFPSVQKADFNDAYKPGLGGMERFASALGHPERTFRSIHIAGTNGKGSVASMLSSVLSGAGLKVGLYTSPHLEDFRERARIVQGGRSTLISKEYVFGFLTEWEPRFEEMDLSFFEITTGLAFKYFSDERVDIAVIETGLGGRLDSTNVITPELSIITSIGLDHCHMLGDTRAEIAAEKAGIFKPGVPALVASSDEETAPVFEDAAWMVCPLSFADRKAPSMWYRHDAILSKMDLKGEYQACNLRTVLAAVDILSQMPGFDGLKDQDAVAGSLIRTASVTDFHGRWEKLSDLPLVIADIGHNAAALSHNFAQVEKMLQEGTVSGLVIVYGVMKDKDFDSILPLMPRNATYIFVAPDTERAMPQDEILSRFKAFRKSEGLPAPMAYSAESVRSGVSMAISLTRDLSADLNRSASAAKPAPQLIYIGGSAFVVAEASRLFH